MCINDSLKCVPITLTPLRTFTNNNSVAYRVGNLIIISLFFKLDSDAGTYGALYRVPYDILAEHQFVLAEDSGTDSNCCYGYVTPYNAPSPDNNKICTRSGLLANIFYFGQVIIPLK